MAIIFSRTGNNTFPFYIIQVTSRTTTICPAGVRKLPLLTAIASTLAAGSPLPDILRNGEEVCKIVIKA